MTEWGQFWGKCLQFLDVQERNQEERTWLFGYNSLLSYSMSSERSEKEGETK